MPFRVLWFYFVLSVSSAKSLSEDATEKLLFCGFRATVETKRTTPRERPTVDSHFGLWKDVPHDATKNNRRGKTFSLNFLNVLLTNDYRQSINGDISIIQYVLRYCSALWDQLDMTSCLYIEQGLPSRPEQTLY